MQTQPVRRKTITGIVVALFTTIAFIAEQPVYSHVIPLSQAEADSMSARATPSEFIIFTWGGIPDSARYKPWDDFADMDAVMSDLYECGFNTSMFIPARFVNKDLQHARNNNLIGLLEQNYIPQSKDNYSL